MEAPVFQHRRVRKDIRVKITIPNELHDSIQVIKARLAASAPYLTFNLAAIARDAVEEAVRRAQQELDRMERQAIALTPESMAAREEPY
ncbi:MAG: hypothetical protein IDH49_08605 [Gammaproteobacteria bacterium]|nr:hypothetical protein [Gammaproteobacteria bacterium]